MNPNKTQKLTKKFLQTLDDGTVIKSNCLGPFKSVWQVKNSNHAEIWDEAKELGLNNRLCHTFSSIDHLDAFEDTIYNLPSKDQQSQGGGCAHWYSTDDSTTIYTKAESSKSDVSGCTDDQFESAYHMIDDFWVNFAGLNMHPNHSSQFVSNLHVFLSMTTIMADVCDEDPRLEAELSLAIYKFCRRLSAIICLSDKDGGFHDK